MMLGAHPRYVSQNTMATRGRSESVSDGLGLVKVLVVESGGQDSISRIALATGFAENRGLAPSG